MPNDNWCTPQWVLDPIYEFFGEIDLDPFYNENSIVKANKYYTKEDDGYKQPWRGRVFANPPYSKPNLALASEKARAEYNESSLDGITAQILLLIPANTATTWFQSFVFYTASLILFYRKRISFLGEKKGSPTFPSVLVYWGNNADAFYECFSSQGTIILP